MELTTIWFVLIAVLWIGYFCLEGFDFGVGMLLPGAGPQRPRAPDHDQHDRPGLGRQRGLGADRRWRDLRRVPGVVRHVVQRVLPPVAPDPARPHRARARVRVPPPAPGGRLEGALGPGPVRRVGAAGLPVGGGVRQHRPRGADRRRQGVHRQPAHPAQPVRPPGRGGDAAALPDPRCDVPGAQDRRGPAPPRRPPERPRRAWRRRSRRSPSWCGRRSIAGDAASAVLFVVAALALVGGVAWPRRRPGGLGVHGHLRRRSRWRSRGCSSRCSRT